MTFFKRFMLAASACVGIQQASASQTFNFNGVTDDRDRFNLTFQTEDTVSTTNVPLPYTAPNSGLTSPDYTFTGYLITGISGNWYEAIDPTTAIPIVSLYPAGSIIDNSVDTIAHSLTDNLFDPKIVGQLSLGNLSYGGVEFSLANGDKYQVFTDPATGGYAGCPGTCVGVTEVDAPGTLPLLGVGLAFVWSRGILRRVDTAR